MTQIDLIMDVVTFTLFNNSKLRKRNRAMFEKNIFHFSDFFLDKIEFNLDKIDFVFIDLSPSPSQEFIHFFQDGTAPYSQ